MRTAAIIILGLLGVILAFAIGAHLAFWLPF